jgi:hypothetical protein
MIRRLQQILSCFLAAVILFASTGVVIASHICHESKKTDVSIFESKGCCSMRSDNCAELPPAADHFKNNCCQLTVSWHKADVTSVQPGFSKCIAQALSSIVIAEIIQYPTAFIIHSADGHDTGGTGNLLAGSDKFFHSIRLLLI